MDGISATPSKPQLAPSWELISLGSLIKLTGIPALIAAIVWGALSFWRIRYPDLIGEAQFVSIGVIAYVILLAVMATYIMRKVAVNSKDLVVIMGSFGLFSGLLVAVLKIVMNYHGWALFRLIAEPLTTALAAIVVGTVTFFQFSRFLSTK